MTILILYDGICGLCARTVQFFLSADDAAKLRFAPLQGKTAQVLLERRPDMNRNLQTILLVRDFGGPSESVYDRSDAVLLSLSELGGIWKMVSYLRILPQFLRDGIYNWIAERRYGWFGRYDTCPAPDPSVRGRFLP